jgi:hypothetical protein
MSYYKNIYREIREFKENKSKRNSTIDNENEENNIETNAKAVLEDYIWKWFQILWKEKGYSTPP